jgi:hypothetical protein
MKEISQAFLYISILPTLRRLRQKDQEFETSLGYIVRLSQGKKNVNSVYLR